MSKTIIGFFEEPLSQEEIDYIYSELEQGYRDNYWNHVFQTLSREMQEVCNYHSGTFVSNEQFSALLHEPFSRWIKDRMAKREIDPKEVYSFKVDFSDDFPGHYSIEYSPAIVKMRDGGYEYHSAQIPVNKHQRALVQDINDHLIKNPHLREIAPHHQKVEDLNNELMGILRSRGYQSETNNNLPDFSEFLAKLVK